MHIDHFIYSVRVPLLVFASITSGESLIFDVSSYISISSVGYGFKISFAVLKSRSSPFLFLPGRQNDRHPVVHLPNERDEPVSGLFRVFLISLQLPLQHFVLEVGAEDEGTRKKQRWNHAIEGTEP